ncbi:MAG: hypothetical protein AAFR17_02055 [Pseudomonadota bacterium]
MAPKSGSEGRRERGIAIFAVIWLSMLIAAVSVSVTRDTRLTVDIAVNERAEAQALARAEGALRWAALVLLAGARGQAPAETGFAGGAELRVDGTPLIWRFEGRDVRLSALAERGKLDLNTADPWLITGLAASLASDRSEQLATAILVARRRDGQSLAWRIGQRPIDQVADLARLAPVDHGLYRRLAPLVTVLSGLRAPDLAVAPEALFRALPLGEEERAYWRGRRGVAPVPVLRAQAETFTLTAETREGAEAPPVRLRALLRLAPAENRPIHLIRLERY